VVSATNPYGRILGFLDRLFYVYEKQNSSISDVCAGNFSCFMGIPLQYGINLLNGDGIGSKMISCDAYCNLIDWSVLSVEQHSLNLRLRNLY
jgi:hypothetical protein